MGMYDSLLNTAYQSKLGRTGDAAGMNQWTNQIDAWARSGMSGDQINKTVMDAFGNTPEGQAYAKSQAQPQAQPMTLDKIGGGYADTSQGKVGAPTAGQMTGGYADPNAAPTAGKLGMAQGGTPLINVGSKVGMQYSSGGDTYWDNSGDQAVQRTRDRTWNTEGLNFGPPPVPGATPVIEQDGTFSGWKGPDGKYLVPTAATGAMSNLGNINFGPSVNGYSVNNTGTTTGYNQTGPQNIMERIASYSPYIIGAMAAGGAGLAATGMTGAEASALVSGGAAGGAGGGAAGLETLGSGAVAPTVAADTGLVDAGTLAGGAGGAGGGAGAVEAGAANPYAIGAEELGAPMATPGSVAPVAGEGGAATLGTAGSTASTASTMTQISDYVKKGMSVMEAIQKVMGGQAGAGGAGGQAGGGGGIMDLLGAYYSAQQQKDLAGNLKAPYSEMQGRQDPYNQLLLNSYLHPEQFYDSSTWKGLESVYQNSIDRGAARGGTLANPTDRERLLQSYGMKELENYRNGLRGNVNAYDPTRLGEMYQKGLVAEAYANTAPFAAWQKAGGAQGVMNTVVNTASTAADIWKLIEGWFTDKP